MVKIWKILLSYQPVGTAGSSWCQLLCKPTYSSLASTSVRTFKLQRETV